MDISNILGAVFNASPLPSLVLLPDAPKFTILEANSAYIHASNTSRSDLIGKGFFEVLQDYKWKYNDFALSEMQQSLSAVVANEVPDQLEPWKLDFSERKGKSGGSTFWKCINSPIKEENGPITHILHSIQDITGNYLNQNRIEKLEREVAKREERIEANERVSKNIPDQDPTISTVMNLSMEALQAEEINNAKYNQEALINGTADLIWSVDTDYRIISANKGLMAKLESISGRKIKEGDYIFDKSFGEGVIKQWKSYYNRAFQGEKFSVKTETLKPNDDQIEWEQITFSPLYKDNGLLWGAACYAKDITTETLNLKAIESAKEELKKIMDSSLDIICTIDEEGRFINISAAAFTMWGYKEEQLIGKPYIQFVHPDDVERTLLAASNIMEGTEMTNFENRYVDIKGNIVPMVWSVRWDKEERVFYSIAKNATEKIKAEEELKKSEENHKLIFQYSPLPKFIYDLQTYNILDVNKSAIAYYGYSREEFLNMTIMSIRPRKEIPKVFRDKKDLRNHNGIIKFGIFTQQKKDKSLIEVEVSGSLITYNGRECMILVCNDVTEKEQILQKLKENEDDLLIAQKIAKLGYWQLQVDNMEIFWSDEVYNIWGRSKDSWQINLEAFLDTVHPDDKDRYFEEYKKATIGEIELDIEHRILLPDGSVKWVHGLGKSIRGDNGAIVALKGSVQDITESKHATEKLTVSEARYRAIFDSQTSFVIRTDLSGNLTYFNNKFLADFGWLYPDQEVLGRNCMLSVMEHHQQLVIDVVMKCMESPNEVFQVEIDKPKKDGGVRTTIWDFICLTDINRLPVEIQCVGIDITDRKKAEDALSSERNLLRTLIDNLPDHIYVKDLEFRHIIQNRASWKSLGAGSEKEVLGTTVLDHHERDIALGFLEDDKRVIEKDQPLYDKEEYIINNKGELRWLLTTKIPLKDVNENTIGLIGISKDISELKKREHHLKLLESVIVHAKDSVMIIGIASQDNPDPRIIYINPAFTKMTGYTAEEILGKPPRMLHGPKTDQQELARLKKSLENREACEATLINYRKNGEEYWININISLLANDKGIPTHFIAIERDVTEKIRQEQNLLEANRNIFNTLESIQDGFYALDREWTVTYWNKEAEKLLRARREEILGKNLWDYYKDDIPLKFFKEYHKAMEERMPVRFEEYFASLNSWFDISAYPSNDGITVYFKDITARKKAETEVLEVYEERNNILESIGDAFIAVDSQWTVTYWNKEAEKVLSKLKQEIVGKNFWKEYLELKDTQFYDYCYKALNENHVQHFEYYSKTIDKWFEMSVFPSNNGLSIYFRDITDRKISEIRLSELNENLRKYTKDLAISNKELENFAYVASHDLQEPLRMITSFLALIEKRYQKVLDEKGQQYIHFAVDGANRMRQIILDLLEYSRVGRIEEDIKTIDLVDLLQDIISLYRKQISEVHAKIEYKDLATIKTYKTPLRQIFQNLIGNALKYHSKKNPPKIVISSIEKASHWQFSIEDNGIGIHPEYFDRIFIIFQRLHNKNDYSGTGIGLAICKKIVENLGGKIWLKSEEGKGSTFFFTIPKMK